MNVLRRMPIAIFWAVDCLLSALTGGAPGQTISARLGEAVRKGSVDAVPFARAVDRIFLIFGETDHCRRSDEAFRARLNAAPFGG